MVPRERKEKPRRGSVRNFLEPQDFSSIELRPSPIDSDETIPDEYENSEDEGDLDIPVTDDSYQVRSEVMMGNTNQKDYSRLLQIEGQGDVEVSLGEASQTQHRYQISRGRDGEVNIDVVVGEDRTGPGEEKDIVIDNKDYNYTLIISGQNIQVIHHDTNRNLTYRHGLDVRILIEYECWNLYLYRRVRYPVLGYKEILRDPQRPSNNRIKKSQQNLRDTFLIQYNKVCESSKSCQRLIKLLY